MYSVWLYIKISCGHIRNFKCTLKNEWQFQMLWFSRGPLLFSLLLIKVFNALSNSLFAVFLILMMLMEGRK